MSSFDWKKSVEDFIKDGLIITDTATEIFFTLKSTGLKPPKTSLDAMDIMKLTCNLLGSVGERLCSVQEMDQRVIQQILWPFKGNKINATPNADPCSKGCAAAAHPSNSFLCCFTFQWLKSRWGR